MKTEHVKLIEHVLTKASAGKPVYQFEYGLALLACSDALSEAQRPEPQWKTFFEKRRYQDTVELNLYLSKRKDVRPAESVYLEAIRLLKKQDAELEHLRASLREISSLADLSRIGT